MPVHCQILWVTHINNISIKIKNEVKEEMLFEEAIQCYEICYFRRVGVFCNHGVYKYSVLLTIHRYTKVYSLLKEDRRSEFSDKLSAILMQI